MSTGLEKAIAAQDGDAALKLLAELVPEWRGAISDDRASQLPVVLLVTLNCCDDLCGAILSQMQRLNLALLID